VRSSSAISLALFLAVLAAPRAAHATPEEEAELLLKKGFQARVDGDDAQALELFEAADQLAPSPRTKAQLGLTLHGLQRWLASHRALSEALRTPRHPWIAKNRSTLETTRTFVEEQLGVIELRGVDAGAVSIDGEPTTPLTPPKTRVAVEPGAHRLTLTWVDGGDARADVDAPKGKVTPLELAPLRRARADAAPVREDAPPLDADPHATRRALGWTAVTVGGLGLALAAVGVGLAVSGATSYSDLGCSDDDDPFSGILCSDARGQRDTGTALAIGAGLAGAALLTTGVVVLVSTPTDASGAPAGAVVTVLGRF
jgi:hypothetical protein